MHKYVRDHTTDNFKYFVEDLGKEKWGDITSATNVNVQLMVHFLVHSLKHMKNIARLGE